MSLSKPGPGGGLDMGMSALPSGEGFGLFRRSGKAASSRVKALSGVVKGVAIIVRPDGRICRVCFIKDWASGGGEPGVR